MPRCKFIHNLPCEQVSDRIIELEEENAKLDRIRRSLHADVERLGGIIHRQRKELSTMQYVIECRNDDNAKLRQEHDLYRELFNLTTQPDRYVQVRDENAKLRELVRDMFEEIEVGGFDPMVERHGKSTIYYEEDPSWRVGIRERMRELGIEVE